MDGDWLRPELGNETLTLTVDEGVYSVGALLRAAYWFTDRAYIFVTKPNEGSFEVHFKAKLPSLEMPSPLCLSDVAGEFGNALLDYQLRETIEDRTGKIRELLVTKALGEAGLGSTVPPGSPNDPVANQSGVDLGRLKP